MIKIIKLFKLEKLIFVISCFFIKPKVSQKKKASTKSQKHYAAINCIERNSNRYYLLENAILSYDKIEAPISSSPSNTLFITKISLKPLCTIMTKILKNS